MWQDVFLNKPRYLVVYTSNIITCHINILIFINNNWNTYPQ